MKIVLRKSFSFEADVTVPDDGMFQELGVVVGGEVGAVVGSAAFFAGQSRAGDERSRQTDVGSFIGAPCVRMSDAGCKLIEPIDGAMQALFGAHDADVLPYQVLHFADQIFQPRVDWPV